MLLSSAPPEEGRRMTKGSGRSACFRGGVTYGHMECLRKGRVRIKAATQVREPRVVRRTCEELQRTKR